MQTIIYFQEKAEQIRKQTYHSGTSFFSAVSRM